MKVIGFLVFLVSCIGLISCEKDPDTELSDFVDPALIEQAIRNDNPPDTETPVETNIPSPENPILIGNVNGVGFNAVRSDIRIVDVEGVRTLNMVFVDTRGNQVMISIENPVSGSYEIDVLGVPSFEAIYTDRDSGDNFITRETPDSMDSAGVLMLAIIDNMGSTEISAQFEFSAFLETPAGVTPARSIGFLRGSLVNLPVNTN